MSRRADFLVPAGEGFTATKVVLLGKFGISFDGRTTHPFFLTVTSRQGMDFVAVTEGETKAFFGLLNRDGLVGEGFETLPSNADLKGCVVWLGDFTEQEIPDYLEAARKQTAAKISRIGLAKFLEVIELTKPLLPADLEAAYLAS